MNYLKLRIIWCGFFCAFLLAPRVEASDIVWTNALGGNWNSTSNWSPNIVPASSDNVFITTPGTYTVILNTSATVQSLRIGGANGTQGLTNNTLANTLILTGPSSIESSGVLGWANGTLTGDGELSVSGRFFWTGGTQSGLGATIINASGTMPISGTSLKTLAGRPWK
jgi:hypothetical protein